MEYFDQILKYLASHLRDILEILLLASIIYAFYKMLRRSRSGRIFTGLVAALLLLALTSQYLQLNVIYWALKSATAVLIFALIVIFQPELRRALAQIGGNRYFSIGSGQHNLVNEIVNAVIELSKNRHGALIAIENETDLSDYAESGAPLDSLFTPELCRTIFYPKSPLHDGGMILQGQRVAAAACIFPVSQKELNDRSIGLRHRAGLGVTEESDAIAIVVSEETGSISICHNGKIFRNLDAKGLKSRMEELLFGEKSED